MPGCHECYEGRHKETPVVGAREHSQTCELFAKQKKKGVTFKAEWGWKGTMAVHRQGF